MLNRQIEKLYNSGACIMKNSEIKAVHSSDLEIFLDSIGEIEPIQSQLRKCYFCGELITLKNIHSVFPLNHEIQYCCKKESCYNILLERGSADA